MTIISKGITSDKLVARVTCGDCRSVLDITRGECKFHSDRDDSWYGVKCVVCNTPISIDPNKFVFPNTPAVVERKRWVPPPEMSFYDQ